MTIKPKQPFREQADELSLKAPESGQRATKANASGPSFADVFVDTMSEGAAVLRGDGTVLFCNRHFATMLQAEPSDIVGNTMLEFVSPPDRPTLAAFLRDAAEGERKGEFVLRARNDGDLRAYLSARTTEHGDERRICLLAIDLTQHKEELDRVVASMVDAVLVFDAQRNAIRANAAAIRMLGFDPVGMKRLQIERRAELYWPDGRAAASDELPSARGLRGETIADLPIVVVRDGKRLSFNVSCSPIRTGAEISGVVTVWHDVTEFERTTKALRESEDRYRSLFENCRDGICITDTDGSICDANAAACRLLNMSREEICLAGREHLVVKTEALASAIEERRRTGHMSLELTFIRKDGSCFPAETTSVSLSREPGERAFVIFRDVTERKRAEEALHASLAEHKEAQTELQWTNYRLQEILESIRDDFYVIDRQWRFAHVNRHFTSKFGKTPQDLIGTDVWELFPRHRGTVFEDNCRAAMDRGDAQRFELRGQYTDADYRVTVFPSAEGITVLVTDITEQKRFERAQQQSETRFRSFFETAAVGMAELSLDGRLREVNDRYCELTGHSRQELLRMGPADLAVPEEVESVKVRLELLLRGDQNSCQATERYLRKDGRIIWVQVAAAMVRDSNGTPLHMAAVIVDVTELKEAEDALREREDHYRTLYDASPSGIVVIGQDGRIVEFNERAHCQLGYTQEEFARLRVLDIDADMSQAEICARIERIFDAGAELFETRQRTKTGELRNMIVDSRAFKTKDEKRLLSVWRDITDHKRIEAALRQADQHKNQFIAMLSHELRNPLAPIRNSVYILEHAVPGGEQSRKAIAVIQRQTSHMTRLIDDLLDVTRVSRGKIQLQREDLDLCDVVRRAIEDFRAGFDANQISLDLVECRGSLPVHGDRTRLAQLVGNLLHNAGKFTPRGGRVTVCLERDAGENTAIVRVRDNGAGIAPDVLPTLFRPFSQAENTLDRSRGGLGLGLSLVKGLVELHGGSVQATSKGIGHGAEFTVRIPLWSKPEKLGAAHVDASHGQSCRVLIIEDNPDAAESLREVLLLFGHEVATAYNGPEGIERAHAFHPDVVLCDIGLPEMDGYDVARAFRSDEALSSAFLVALSGYAMPDDRRRASEAGFDRHVSKPPKLSSLERILGEAGTREERRELLDP